MSANKSRHGAEALENCLRQAGYEDFGGGRAFSAWGTSPRGRVVYVFHSPAGSGPDDSHWIEVDSEGNDETFLAGGFSVLSLQQHLTK